MDYLNNNLHILFTKGKVFFFDISNIKTRDYNSSI